MIAIESYVQPGFLVFTANLNTFIEDCPNAVLIAYRIPIDKSNLLLDFINLLTLLHFYKL